MSATETERQLLLLNKALEAENQRLRHGLTEGAHARIRTWEYEEIWNHALRLLRELPGETQSEVSVLDADFRRLRNEGYGFVSALRLIELLAGLPEVEATLVAVAAATEAES